MELRSPQDYIGDDLLKFAEQNEWAIKERCLQEAAKFLQSVTIPDMVAKYRKGEAEHGGMTLARLALFDAEEFMRDEIRDLFWYIAISEYKRWNEFLESPETTPRKLGQP